LLKYNQLSSDFHLPLVRECRGIILDEQDGYRPVCIPFFKFGNYGESYVPEIDWASARVQEKIDGSLMKLWYDKGAWHVSSNGEIDARNANINSLYFKTGDEKNLYALFMEAWQKTGVDMCELDTEYAYLFELVSPHNRVVVPYSETTIYHIGTRSNTTAQETNKDIGVPKPQEYAISTLEDCIAQALRLGHEAEGYVVVDKFYNRIKVKSPVYVAMSHLVQGVGSRERIIEIIKANEHEEFLNYFPEYREIFDEIQTGIDQFSKRVDQRFQSLHPNKFETRKMLAEAVAATECPACLFALIDGKAASAKAWVMSRQPKKILELIEI
jgi:T4 RnlA family RNA ligase